MEIAIYDKEFVQLMNSLQPNITISLDSLTSIYERLASFDSTISCDRKTLNHLLFIITYLQKCQLNSVCLLLVTNNKMA